MSENNIDGELSIKKHGKKDIKFDSNTHIVINIKFLSILLGALLTLSCGIYFSISSKITDVKIDVKNIKENDITQINSKVDKMSGQMDIIIKNYKVQENNITKQQSPTIIINTKEKSSINIKDTTSYNNTNFKKLYADKK